MVPDDDLPKYLGRVDDGGGHFRWSITYTREQLARILATKLFDGLGELHDLTVTRRGYSGRALSLDVVYDDRAGVRRTVTVEGQHAIRDAPEIVDASVMKAMVSIIRCSNRCARTRAGSIEVSPPSGWRSDSWIERRMWYSS